VKARRLITNIEEKIEAGASSLGQIKSKQQAVIGEGDLDAIEELNRELTTRQGERNQLEALLADAKAHFEKTKAAAQIELQNLVDAALGEVLRELNAERKNAHAELAQYAAPYLMRVVAAEEALGQTDRSKWLRKLSIELELT
jgi:hypothetical protein